MEKRSANATVLALAAAGAALCILSANLWVVRHAGNVTPFYDEWGALVGLLKPYVEGNLGLRELFRPLNEHIILFPRVVILLIYNISGYYDVVSQMIVNAAVKSAMLSVLTVVLTRGLDRAVRLYVLLFVVLISALPFAWENNLIAVSGTEFYLMTAFSAAGLFLIVGANALTLR
jgi:hypothetical protein